MEFEKDGKNIMKKKYIGDEKLSREASRVCIWKKPYHMRLINISLSRGHIDTINASPIIHHCSTALSPTHLRPHHNLTYHYTPRTIPHLPPSTPPSHPPTPTHIAAPSSHTIATPTPTTPTTPPQHLQHPHNTAAPAAASLAPNLPRGVMVLIFPHYSPENFISLTSLSDKLGII